jgi:uncharacterized protein (TIGR00369 family)
MPQLVPVLDADGVNALTRRAFPDAPDTARPRCVEVGPGRVRLLLPYHAGMLRPGGVISGPTLMSMADSVGYCLVLSHIGDQLMAVTSQLNMSFLRGAVPGDIHAEGQMLRLGRRLAVMDARIWTESPDRLAAQAIVTYAIPA